MKFMQLFRALPILNRRHSKIEVLTERRNMRGGPLRRMAAANDRLDAASDALYQTIMEHTDKLHGRNGK